MKFITVFDDLVDGAVRKVAFRVWWHGLGALCTAASWLQKVFWHLRYKGASIIIDFGKPKEEEL